MSDVTNENENEVIENDEAAEASDCPEGFTTISATAKVNGERITATFFHDFLDSALDAAGTWGDAVVHAGFIRAAKIDAQSRMRALLEAGKNPDEVAENMTTSWYPGAKNIATKDELLASFGKMSAEEKAEMLARLQAQL